MLCSLPNANAKSRSASASASAWLDRLHARNPIAPPPPPPTVATCVSISPSDADADGDAGADVMGGILADLFVMDPISPPHSSLQLQLQSSGGRGSGRGRGREGGGGRARARGRPLRKQPTPKICLFTSPSPSPSPSAPPTPHLHLHLKKTIQKPNNNNNHLNLNLKLTNKNNQKKKNNYKNKSKIQAQGRTEATVIDTSTPGWKSPKIFIRKGPSFWKILDKKQWNAGLNKRKRLHLASTKQNHLLDSHNPSHPSNQGDNHEESVDVLQVPVKRPKFSKLPSIPEAAKSIALHLEVRTKGKKKGPSSSSSPKEKVQP